MDIHSVCFDATLSHMRTTIHLDDHLLARIKAVAASTGRTMTTVIEDALKQSLQPDRLRARKKVRLTTVGGRGVKPGVDLDDSASLLDFLEKKR